jgi:hypothetical protein
MGRPGDPQSLAEKARAHRNAHGNEMLLKDEKRVSFLIDRMINCLELFWLRTNIDAQAFAQRMEECFEYLRTYYYDPPDFGSEMSERHVGEMRTIADITRRLFLASERIAEEMSYVWDFFTHFGFPIDFADYPVVDMN